MKPTNRNAQSEIFFLFKEASIIFNKENFGNIFKNKRKLEARIKGV